MQELEEFKLYELYHYLEFYRLHKDVLSKYRIEDVFYMAFKRYEEANGVMLDFNDKDNQALVYNWLRSVSRKPLLNELVGIMAERLLHIEEYDGCELNNVDTYFVNNIDLMLKIIEDEYYYICDNMQQKNVNLSKINTEEVNKIIIDMLSEIDVDEKWLEVYGDAITNDKIVYMHLLDDDSIQKIKGMLGLIGTDNINNTCMYLGDKDRYLFLNYQGDISDVPLTMHEIIHYINAFYDDARNVPPLLREFPSLFYEIMCLQKLSNLGYDSSEINAIYQQRLRDIYNAILEITDILYYLEIYIKNGKIDDVVDNRMCDKCIYELMNDPFMLFKTYPYIISFHLAKEAVIKVREDKTLLSIIKYMSERLSEINPGDIFDLLKIDGRGNTKTKKY